MARDKDTVVFEFLRDAQYRVSELSIEIDQKKQEDKRFRDEQDLRSELLAYMDILWDSIHDIKDGYTLLDWPDREIIEECDALRQRADMAEIPYITFAGYNPQIINEIIGEGTSPGGSTNIPQGTVGQIITYNASGLLIATDFPSAGGMLNDSIDEYFD